MADCTSERIMIDKPSPSSIDSDFRALTFFENALVVKMLAALVLDRDVFLAQLKSARVRAIDDDGSIMFRVSADAAEHTVDGPIINAVQLDRDSQIGYGPFINYVLFVKDGFLSDLQVYKDDGSSSIDKPSLGKIVDIYRAR
jgi:hypothetical protein